MTNWKKKCLSQAKEAAKKVEIQGATFGFPIAYQMPGYEVRFECLQYSWDEVLNEWELRAKLGEPILIGGIG